MASCRYSWNAQYPQQQPMKDPSCCWYYLSRLPNHATMEKSSGGSSVDGHHRKTLGPSGKTSGYLTGTLLGTGKLVVDDFFVDGHKKMTRYGTSSRVPASTFSTHFCRPTICTIHTTLHIYNVCFLSHIVDRFSIITARRSGDPADAFTRELNWKFLDV